MKKYADLHIHTNFSDSNLSPEEVIDQAYHGGLHCIAIVDHDTMLGVAPAMEAAKKFEVEVIPGIELSSELNGKDVHILGYFIDYNDETLIRQLHQIQNTRIERMDKMIDKLKIFGINNINLKEVCALANSDSVGRPHLAAVLKEKGWVSTIKQAFEKYIGDDAPAYVPKYKQTPTEAIQLIRKAGGLAVLAHPMLTQVDELIPDFVNNGLRGLEVYYPNVSNTVLHFYENLAKKHQLLITGGSDSHGTDRVHAPIGRIKIPYHLVEDLKQEKGF